MSWHILEPSELPVARAREAGYCQDLTFERIERDGGWDERREGFQCSHLRLGKLK